MKPIPRLADDMRIYLATEKMENQEILETLIESREDNEAALMSARQKVSDIFMSYILPAEKGARSKKLDHDGFLALLLELTAKFPKDWRDLRDKYEADGIKNHSERLNAMIDKYEELSTVFQSMVDEAKE
ncbi:MAG: hypothetical protein IKL57_01550 [Oscillospiraceae bacterium]|nr:hypothetical protein [Oscillospiraceae bacterium]MBR3610138.1 hypothetical protein [Oscillospiraceae bacterium]MBR3953277.1 hypothetical protein [Oscillospiraceae bacterium]